METLTSLSTDPKDYRHFLLYTGYVESNAIAPLVVSHRFAEGEKAATWQEAWEHSFHHFRKCLWECVKLENGYPSDIEGTEWMRNLKECCTSAMENVSTAFCPKCGTQLSKLREEELEPFRRVEMCESFVDTLVGSTNDSAGYDYWELMDANGWYMPGFLQGAGIPRDSSIITVIHERAECLLGDYEGSKNSYLWDAKKEFWNNVDFGVYTPLKGPTDE